MPTRASMRLNQFLASAGLGSRRACEKFIREGFISINGKKVTRLATQVRSQDKVYYQDKELQLKATKRYFLFHKPSGVVCSKHDEGRYPSIYQLLPKEFQSLFYVGRLDADSEGLLLLTDDGYWAQYLMHPRYEIEKIYHVTIDRPLEFRDRGALLKGCWLDGKRARFKAITFIKGTSYQVILNQGLKRQIRRQLIDLGYAVKHLVRVQFGKIRLGSLPKGRFRVLKTSEIQAFSINKTVK